MEEFVHRQNLLFFRKQLAETPSEAQRVVLLKLLAEEEAKDNGPSNPLSPHFLVITASTLPRQQARSSP